MYLVGKIIGTHGIKGELKVKSDTSFDRFKVGNVLYVEKEYRGQGIGNKLMSRLISIAIENKVTNITLEVRIGNIVARNLYKKFGFREVALRKFYYGDEDGILMEKQVM